MNAYIVDNVLDGSRDFVFDASTARSLMQGYLDEMVASARKDGWDSDGIDKLVEARRQVDAWDGSEPFDADYWNGSFGIDVREGRRALIEGAGMSDFERVARYLPSNYKLRLTSEGLLVEGYDSHGWTLDGYVIPRLASGLIFLREVTDDPESSYLIRRFYQRASDPDHRKVIRTGLTLAEAQAHCQREDTHGGAGGFRGLWFDGYEQEVES